MSQTHDSNMLPRTMGAFRKFAQLAKLFILVIAHATCSLAQEAEATPLDRYEPSTAHSPLGGISTAETPAGRLPSLELRLSIARSPLILVRTDGDEETREKIVGHQMLLHGLASFQIVPKLSLDVDVPVILSQGGETPAGDVPISPPNGASLADLRAALSLQMVEQRRSSPALAFRLALWAPTGNSGEFAGAGAARLSPQFVAGASGPAGAYGLQMGPRMTTQEKTGLLDSEVFIRAGGGPRFGRVLLTGEVLSTFQREEGDVQPFSHVPHLELLAHSKIDMGDWFVRLGASMGLGNAIGTPAYRGILGIGYAPAKKASTDKPVGPEPTPEESVSSNPNEGEASEEPEPPSAEAPLSLSECPKEGSANVPPHCAPDQDGDGISDPEDACPDRAGVLHPLASKHGCPLDSDGDAIEDEKDACPEEAGIETDDEKTHGCPRSVRVEGEQIVILQQVVFATGSAIIAEESHELLQEVANILLSHPQISRVQIEGHTDNVGRLTSNMKLSRARALAVMRWLIDHGVDEERLQATGYGPKRPVDSNDTLEGQRRNRRVEFHILERTTDTPPVKEEGKR